LYILADRKCSRGDPYNQQEQDDSGNCTSNAANRLACALLWMCPWRWFGNRCIDEQQIGQDCLLQAFLVGTALNTSSQVKAELGTNRVPRSRPDTLVEQSAGFATFHAGISLSLANDLLRCHKNDDYGDYSMQILCEYSVI